MTALCDDLTAGAVPLLASIRTLQPWLRHVFADGAYAGAKLAEAFAGLGRWTLAIVKRSETADGFELLPRRWCRAQRSLGSAATAALPRTSRPPS